MPLKRELGLFSTTLYGIGVIIGAGIYALIGVGAGLAGNLLWFSFLISALIAIFTGLSYAELSGVFPKDAAEYNYTRKAFNRELLSFVIGWLLVVGTIVAASTVARGFAGYFSSIFGGEIGPIAAGLLVVMAFLNYFGIKESARFNNFASILEVLGLLIVIAIGFFFVSGAKTVNLFELPQKGFAGIMAAVSVVFFAYTGFESVANLSEEVKASRKIVPKALLLALAISSVLYVLVSIAAVKEVGWEALKNSDAPLTLVASGALGDYSIILSFIALLSTANTALIFMIVSSRILYGMARRGSLPTLFCETGSRGTPYFSVFAVGLVAAFAAYVFEIKTVAQITDLALFVAYFAVNVSLISLAGSAYKRTFKSPRIAGIPVFAWLGALTSLAMLAFFPVTIWLMEIVILGVGLVLFLLYKRRKSSG